jgi:hypothetical protein
LSEKAVTLECIQLEALTVDENVRFNLNNPLTPKGSGDKQQAYIDEDKIIPKREMS